MTKENNYQKWNKTAQNREICRRAIRDDVLSLTRNHAQAEKKKEEKKDKVVIKSEF